MSEKPCSRGKRIIHLWDHNISTQIVTMGAVNKLFPNVLSFIVDNKTAAARSCNNSTTHFGTSQNEKGRKDLKSHTNIVLTLIFFNTNVYC